MPGRMLLLRALILLPGTYLLFVTGEILLHGEKQLMEILLSAVLLELMDGL